MAHSETEVLYNSDLMVQYIISKLESHQDVLALQLASKELYRSTHDNNVWLQFLRRRYGLSPRLETVHFRLQRVYKKLINNDKQYPVRFFGAVTDGGCDENSGVYWVDHLFGPNPWGAYCSKKLTYTTCVGILNARHLEADEAELQHRSLIIERLRWQWVPGPYSAPLQIILEQAAKRLAMQSTFFLESQFHDLYLHHLNGMPDGRVLMMHADQLARRQGLQDGAYEEFMKQEPEVLKQINARVLAKQEAKNAQYLVGFGEKDGMLIHDRRALKLMQDPGAAAEVAVINQLEISRAGRYSCPVRVGAVMMGMHRTCRDHLTKQSLLAVRQQPAVTALQGATTFGQVQHLSQLGQLPPIAQHKTEAHVEWVEFAPVPHDSSTLASSSTASATDDWITRPLQPVVWFRFVTEAEQRGLQPGEEFVEDMPDLMHSDDDFDDEGDEDDDGFDADDGLLPLAHLGSSDDDDNDGIGMLELDDAANNEAMDMAGSDSEDGNAGNNAGGNANQVYVLGGVLGNAQHFAQQFAHMMDHLQQNLEAAPGDPPPPPPPPTSAAALTAQVGPSSSAQPASLPSRHVHSFLPPSHPPASTSNAPVPAFVPASSLHITPRFQPAGNLGTNGTAFSSGNPVANPSVSATRNPHPNNPSSSVHPSDQSTAQLSTDTPPSPMAASPLPPTPLPVNPNQPIVTYPLNPSQSTLTAASNPSLQEQIGDSPMAVSPKLAHPVSSFSSLPPAQQADPANAGHTSSHSLSHVLPAGPSPRSLPAQPSAHPSANSADRHIPEEVATYSDVDQLQRSVHPEAGDGESVPPQRPQPRPTLESPNVSTPPSLPAMNNDRMESQPSAQSVSRDQVGPQPSAPHPRHDGMEPQLSGPGTSYEGMRPHASGPASSQHGMGPQAPGPSTTAASVNVPGRSMAFMRAAAAVSNYLQQSLLRHPQQPLQLVVNNTGPTVTSSRGNTNDGNQHQAAHSGLIPQGRENDRYSNVRDARQGHQGDPWVSSLGGAVNGGDDRNGQPENGNRNFLGSNSREIDDEEGESGAGAAGANGGMPSARNNADRGIVNNEVASSSGVNVGRCGNGERGIGVEVEPGLPLLAPARASWRPQGRERDGRGLQEGASGSGGSSAGGSGKSKVVWGAGGSGQACASGRGTGPMEEDAAQHQVRVLPPPDVRMQLRHRKALEVLQVDLNHVRTANLVSVQLMDCEDRMARFDDHHDYPNVDVSWVAFNGFVVQFPAGTEFC